MHLHSILAITDFSTQAEHGLERAALVAAAHQVKLRIVYFTEYATHGFLNPGGRLAQRARQLARRHDITVDAVTRPCNSLNDIVKEAGSADLIVVDDRRQRTLSSLWRGTEVVQLLRHCPCPVLVVKQAPLTHYSSMLVATDFTADSLALVRYGSRFDVNSELELFHTRRTISHAHPALAKKAAARETVFSQEAHRLLRGRMFELTDSFDTRLNRVDWVHGDFDPARQTLVRQKTSGADLVVVGKQRRSTLADVLLGSVAQRLVESADSDVLVVPHGYSASSRAAGKARMQTDLNYGPGPLPVVRRRSI
ncbi:universal stress protein [Polaromonas sp.]|uniref:universal stress protein n=1 Tax=Polaromonas sp. TaxID=1869339 RepID=UPI0013B8DF57|nr:universal stress protein [Polaromonas sp.]NDP63643.1 universal stress protein [Polaromonas sp.]